MSQEFLKIKSMWRLLLSWLAPKKPEQIPESEDSQPSATGIMSSDLAMACDLNTGTKKDTFCILAWKHLQITPNGTAKICCIAAEDIKESKRALSLYTENYDDIWNSDYMLAARQAMAEGQEFSACTRCYREEASLGGSMRTEENAKWMASGEVSRHELIERARVGNWRLDARPVSLQLNMGNLCNLACRMCTSQYSSKIESDPTHSKWVPAAFPEVPRWRGRNLHFGPRPFFGVDCEGFYDYEHDNGSGLRWTAGHGRLRVPLPQGAAITAVGIDLKTESDVAHVTIRCNGTEVFCGTLQKDLVFRRTFPVSVENSEVDLEIISTTTSYGPRLVGVAVADVWAEREMSGAGVLRNERTGMRMPFKGGWWTQPTVLFDELLGESNHMERLTLQGGEPLLLKEFDSILDKLIADGAAKIISFEIVSNCTILKDSTLQKLAQLKQILFRASIDGVGPVIEYVRYPAKWQTIEENLQKLRKLENTKLTFATAVQAYNLLDAVNIFRYCDANGIEAHCHFLVGPRHLHVNVLPRRAREMAITALQNYIDEGPSNVNRSSAAYIIFVLNQSTEEHWRDEFGNFVKFTNDLDVTRAQRFGKLYPDIVRLFEEDGLPWFDETVHAPAAA